MAESIAALGLEPGVYVDYQQITQLPVVPGGPRVVALIGKGKTTKTITEVVTKGSAQGTDELSSTAVSLSSPIVDANLNSYYLDVDYELTAGEVDWSLDDKANTTGTVEGTTFPVHAKTLKFKVNGGAEQTVTFTAAIPPDATQAEILAQITASITGVTATFVANKLHIVVNADVTLNHVVMSSLYIGNGSANADLGLVGGLTVEGSKEPEAAITYTVRYERDKASAEYIPLYFYDIASLRAEYGYPNPEDVDASSIATAAEIVFEQGASVVLGMQLNPADTPDLNGYLNAIEKLKAANLNYLVALTTDSNVRTAVKTHILQMSTLTEGKPRVAFNGLAGSPTVDAIKTIAASLNSERMTLVYPTSIKRNITGINNDGDTVTDEISLDGSYLCAALAGIRARTVNSVSEPLLRKEVTGFTEIPDNLLRSQKNLLAQGGVTLIETIGGLPRVRDWVTTKPATIQTATGEVTDIVDFTWIGTKQLLDAIFIGSKFLNETPSMVKTVTSTILSSLVSLEIITGYDQVQAVRNGIDPRQIDVSFRIAPVYPLKYITVTFSI